MKSTPQFVSGYFDGDLDSDEHAKLRAWLLESRDHVNDFVIDGFIHTQLIDLLGPEQTRANALVAAEVAANSNQPLRPWRLSARLLAIAASLVFVVVLTYFAAFRAEVVATISGSRNVQWAPGSEKQTVGALLHSGSEIALEGGTLYLTFARGGQVALHGPARFQVESDMAGRLLQGRLSAFVPEHAVGFTVRSGCLNIVDLGTEFSTELLTDESCELQVFDGLVEVQFREPLESRASDGKLRISQGRAIRFHAASGKVESIEYDKEKRLPGSTWSK